MKEESDTVQATSRAFGERFVFDQFAAVVERQKGTSLHAILSLLLALYGWSRVEADLGWFLSEQILSPKEGKQVGEFCRQLCNAVAPYILDIVNSFGFPDHAHQGITYKDIIFNTVQPLLEWIGLNSTQLTTEERSSLHYPCGNSIQ